MKNKIFLVAVLIIAAVLIVLSLKEKETRTTSADKTKVEDQAMATGQEPVTSSSQKSNTPSPARQSHELSLEKRENLKKMTKMMAQYARPQKSLPELVDYLKNSGQEPLVAADKQDLIEDMYTVRTNKPLPGTRYFHAEYLEEMKGKDPLFQRMTFEFQPSSESMALAVAAVKASFPDLGKVLYQTDDFIQWELPQGYAASVTKLSAMYLQGHPHNAYTRADIGTMRITIEKRPGGH